MNTILSLVRNAEVQNRSLVPKAVERCTGDARSGKLAALAMAIATTMSLVDGAAAQTVFLPAFDPTQNDNLAGSTVVSNGATVTLQGSATQITPGITGAMTQSLPTLFANGLTTDPHANPTNPASLVINTGTKAQIVTVPDPITGGTRTVAVYANTNIIDTNATSIASPYAVSVNGPTNGRQYINTRIGEVDATGGALNVQIGSLAASTDSAANNINMGMAKQTSLFYADGTGTATSTIIWQGSNRVYMGQTQGAINAVGPGPVQSAPFAFYSYRGTFTSFDGSSHTVNSAADLQAYNSFLIAQLQTGALNPTQYDTEFARAYTSAATPITYTNGPPLPDETYQPVGVRAVIQADGANAQGIIAAGARLDVISVSNFNTTPITSGGMLATNGGTIINNGQLSSQRGGTADVQGGMVIQAGSHGINNGVLNAGFLSGLTGAVDPPVPNTLNANTGGFATGAGATFASNAGAVINVGGQGSMGIQLISSAAGTNAGTINVGVSAVDPTLSGANTRTDGVNLSTGAQFTNLAGGLIYLGRQPQYASGAVVPDIVNNVTPLSGMTVLNTGTATNAGTITIGTLTQGSSGILVSASNTGVINSGVINVNGAASAAPTENDGMSLLNSSNVTNSGTINVNGVNGIGIKLLATGITAVTSSGTINVAGGVGSTGLRNYGIWAEGASATATLSGGVNLSGAGAIGVHARSGGHVNITGAGTVHFLSGSNQIGYFIFGAGSTINNTGTAAQDVSTTNSVLFRIDSGGVFSGGTGGSVFTASGQGATAFDITGAPSTFSSGNMTLNLSGPNATGVLVEGGAVGTIAGTATINQTGIGSIAGIVDGQKFDLTGAPIGVPDPTTSLMSTATLSSALDNVTGYIARNQGKLTNSGNLTFTGAHTTGILVETGATGSNTAAISITNGGIGIDANGPAGGLATTLNNSGTITVNGGSTADRTRGVVAQGPLATANMQTGSTLNLTGVGAIGAEALGGGLVTVAGTATPVFGNTDQIAFHALGASSAVASSATALDASATRATLFRIEDGATLTTSTALTASGQGAAAVVSTGPGARATLDGSALNIAGAGARGLIVEGGATGSIAAGTAVTLPGANAVVGMADGQKHDLTGAAVGALDPATTLTNQAAMTLTGPGALAFISQNQATLVNQGAIAMTGAGAIGVRVLSGGVLNNQAAITVANGTGIDMEGVNSLVRNSATLTASDGVAALHVHDGGGGVLGGALVSNGTAHTVLVGSGATGLNATGATLTSLGAGNGIENAAEIAAITLANTTINVGSGAGIRTATSLDPASTVTVNASGAGTGFAFQTAAGAATTGNLDLGAGYIINGNAAGATGIMARTSGAVTTAASVHMNDAAAGAALVAGTASSSLNTGVLTSSSTVAPVVDLANGTGTSFTNQGTIIAPDVTRTAILGSAGSDAINLAGGAVTGVVQAVGGSNTAVWTGGSLNGSIEMGNGGSNSLRVAGVDLSGTYHLDGGTGAGDALTLEGITYRGGSFAADNLVKGVNLGPSWEIINLNKGTNFALADNLSLGGSTVNVDATSRLNAGAGVFPMIQSTQANAPANVNNAGIIDLTNGASGAIDRLTIVGNYVGQNGQLIIDTVLNTGSDMLVVDGRQGAARASGLTTLTVHYQGDGALIVDDGIQVVSTLNGATTAAGSFVLGNRVAVGAYEYLLKQGGDPAVGGNPNDQNWYLRNTVDLPVEPPIVPPTEPPPVVPPEVPEVDRPDYRVEVPLDMAVPALVNSLGLAMLGTYHDRNGEDFADAGLAEPAKAGWGRIFGSTGNVRYDYGGALGRFAAFVDHGPSYDADTVGFQSGVDLYRTQNDSGTRDIAGFYVAFGHTNSTVQAVLGGDAGTVSMDGYSLGAYWTRKGASGWYADAVVQGTRYGQIRARSDLGQTLNPSGWGFAGSIEGGYPVPLGLDWVIEPQAQLVYQRISLGNDADSFGRVMYDDSNALYGRVGARATRNWTMDDDHTLSTWARVNVWHGFDAKATTTFSALDGLDAVAMDTDLGGSWAQFGLGVSAKVARNTSVFISADYNQGIDGNNGHRFGGRAGVKVVW
ncbi:autotransporter outer membrane beta-barrel domain-containing protein [Dyella japonica]|uniref:Autotransporter family porin n=1 Tax=Dyella japonica TaxID=231455 RepID=A0ABV2K0X9_9GAMM